MDRLKEAAARQNLLILALIIFATGVCIFVLSATHNAPSPAVRLTALIVAIPTLLGSLTLAILKIAR